MIPSTSPHLKLGTDYYILIMYQSYMDFQLQIDDEELTVAVSAAIDAGQHAVEIQEDVSGEKKADGSTVTRADREAENLIRGTIGNQSEFNIIGEELDSELRSTGNFWAVDPIDGTENYSRGQPLYTTSIALIKDGVPEIGVTYVPMTNQVFYAKKGEGSYLNETEISVSNIDDMDDVYMVTDGYGSSRVHHRLSDTTLWIQRPHSAAYSIASVAAGWADFGVLGGLSVWDVATGILLVREAGGEIIPVTEEQDIFDGGFFATNGDDRIENAVRSSLGDSISELLVGK